MKRKESAAEILLKKHIAELNLLATYLVDREYPFHPTRKWRFDFVLIGVNGERGRLIAIEIEGGAWTQGRHTRGKGFEADIRKYNEAAKLGWAVIRFTPGMIQRGESKAFLAELFGRR